MATTAAATAALSMKLLIDRKAQRVLFAETSKDVVDFLFSLLAMPVATAVKLVGKDAMVGCIGNLYASVDNLHSDLLTGTAKDALLCPAVTTSPAATTTTGTSSPLLRLSPAPSFVEATVTTYTVTDDLTVAPAIPMSAISSISLLLNTFAVRNLDDLQEITVQIGYNEGLVHAGFGAARLAILLKASPALELTDVFLHGKAASPGGRA